eukprot:Gb_41742 [translate_table: standard]
MEIIAEGSDDNPILPGFRFHPTEEELVGFYLRRKVEKKPFKINLIEELNLYNYDPWDLGARLGEREWFFFVPRDWRQHSGGRPNRITASGYWKATGTDRGVYGQPGTQLIGFRKTLVFYKGRAPKGEKTDWVMNEYRLPDFQSFCKSSRNEVTLCRVYKKSNSLRSFDRRPRIDVDHKAFSFQISTSSRTGVSTVDLPSSSTAVKDRVGDEDIIPQITCSSMNTSGVAKTCCAETGINSSSAAASDPLDTNHPSFTEFMDDKQSLLVMIEAENSHECNIYSPNGLGPLWNY